MDSETLGVIPIIKLYRDLIVVVQGSLTDAQVSQLKDDTTREIERHDAEGLVISVSGVDLMDSYISRAIHDIALIARYMGVETVVCGISPLVATTLVEMDMGLTGIATALNLERALETLERRRGSSNALDRGSAAAAPASDEALVDEELVFASANEPAPRDRGWRRRS
jgi:rsbT antagonist protein RsbS